jgi:hypothetical protein
MLFHVAIYTPYDKENAMVILRQALTMGVNTQYIGYGEGLCARIGPLVDCFAVAFTSHQTIVLELTKNLSWSMARRD